MTEKISQMYEEEQINKVRNGRKLVPDNKMPNLQWNLEKQEATQKEEIQETEVTDSPNKALEMIIYIVVFIYSYILQLQETEETNRLNRTIQVFIHMAIFIYSYTLLIWDTVLRYTKTAGGITQNTIKTTRNIIRTRWIQIQKEIQAKQQNSHVRNENLKIQSYGSCDGHNVNSPTQ